jgi:transposase
VVYTEHPRYPIHSEKDTPPSLANRGKLPLVAEASSVIQRMQKVLTEMNVQLSHVLSDLSGVSGMKIIGAILKGERDPWTLAALVEPGVKATPEDVAKSLEGTGERNCCLS